MKVGLLFGSFNPVHVGHMIIADYLAANTELDLVWMVLSPQNPFKKKEELASNYQRLYLLDKAIGHHDNIRWSKVEFDLPQPSYTIDTLHHLKQQHPKKEFVLIMGGDNIVNFHKWKSYEEILNHHDILVYSRGGEPNHRFTNHPKVQIIKAPLLDISSTEIRKDIKAGKSVQYRVPDTVFNALNSSELYQ